MLLLIMTFEEFVERDGARLRAGLVAAYGPQVGADAAAEAMAFGFERWERVGPMANPAGYLYRVGQTSARREFRPQGFLPQTAAEGEPVFEPGLAPALEKLSEPQRVGVVLVHGLGWTLRDTAELLDVEVSTLRTHISRAMAKLRRALEVNLDVV
ncbi:MAG: sigma-70 family RNA polymerase sigma factor [Ilumatobacter sp.]|uniref:sigma-70 family RNA polymerase sigma factor n=1 Tax=Ilumatobacter sp. TaxID=1967498 RepID=UPI003C727CD3